MTRYKIKLKASQRVKPRQLLLGENKRVQGKKRKKMVAGIHNAKLN